MSGYRTIERALWADSRFRALSRPQPSGQTIWVWLLAGPATTNIPGIVICKPEAIALYYGWDPFGKAFREAFGEVLAKGLARAAPEDGLIWLPGAAKPGRKSTKPRSPNVIRSWGKTWPLVPECSLKTEALHRLKAFAEGFGQAFAKAFADTFAKISPEQEQEQEQEQESLSPNPSREGERELGKPKGAKPKPKAPAADAKRVAERVVQAFNRAFNRQVGTAGWERGVGKLLAEGYTEREILGVVWWASEEWAGDPQWRMRIDPGTLFKLQSAHGARTFPQYLALAGERWAELEPNKPCPWLPAQEPQLALVVAEGAP